MQPLQEGCVRNLCTVPPDCVIAPSICPIENHGCARFSDDGSLLEVLGFHWPSRSIAKRRKAARLPKERPDVLEAPAIGSRKHEHSLPRGAWASRTSRCGPSSPTTSDVMASCIPFRVALFQ